MSILSWSSVCLADDANSIVIGYRFFIHLQIQAKRDISISNRAKMFETSNVHFGRVLSDLEIIEIVESELSNTTYTDNVFLDMNQIHVTYIDLLKANQSPVAEYLK